MPTKTVIVGSSIGLHARPAAIIAEAVVNAGVPVTLSVDGGEPVDAGSALMIMTLGAANAAQVTVASDDEAALEHRRGPDSAGSRRVVAGPQVNSGEAPVAPPLSPSRKRNGCPLRPIRIGWCYWSGGLAFRDAPKRTTANHLPRKSQPRAAMPPIDGDDGC